jgi:hypothetical protein
MSDYAEKLAGFAELKEGWDSYGAAAMDPETLDGFGVFLKAIEQGSAQIVPTRNGGCQVEVHEQGFDIEVEFDPFTDDDDDAGGVYLMHRSDASGLPKRGEES